MDKKDFPEEDTFVSIDETKELNDLKKWSEEQEGDIETLYQEDFDENMEDSELVFKTKINTEEEMKKNLEQNGKKSWISKLKDWWKSLDKKKKIIIISSVVFGILLIISLVVLFFILFRPAEEMIKEPDVILEMDNYRYENGNLIFLEDDLELGSYECQNKDENLCGVALLTTDDKMDAVKRVDEKGELLSFHSKIYFQKYVFLKDSKKESPEVILYDIENQKVIETAVEVLQTPEYDGYFILKNNQGKYELLSLLEDGVKTLISYDSSYDEIHLIPGESTLSMVAVAQNNHYYLANLENKILTKALNDPIVGANKEHLKTKSATGKYHIYDYQAKEINAGFEMDYVYLLDQYFISVLSQFLYVRDYDGALMSVENISLHNSHYNEVDTIKDNKVIKKELALDYQVNDHILNLNVHQGEDTKNYSIDLYEGALSKTLAFMDYFNGTLYFYTDETKTNPIGYYHCTNRNEVGKDTKTLSTCKPAMDSVFRQIEGNIKEQDEQNEGIIPLFDKEFVFIQDGDTIVLVDLTSEKKEIARYESVDTTTYTGRTELFLSPSDNLNFIAKSKTSGKFGVAQITSSGIKPVISFNKQDIKLLGDYYVVKENDKYALYNKTGEKVSDDRVAKIVDYEGNYLKTLDGTNYFVYPFKGEIVTEKGFDYIELYDKYYAAVFQGRVHLYSYADKEAQNELLVTEEKENGVALYVTNYYDTMGKVLAFQMRFEGNMVYVKVGSLDGNYSKEIGYPLSGSSSSSRDEGSDD